MNIGQSEFQKLFEVVIQLGAILAVFVIYFETISKDRNLIKTVLISFLPTAIIGLILYKIIKNVFFENLVLQLAVFFITGLFFIAYEKVNRKRTLTRDSQDMSTKEAVFVGLGQAMAVVPGVSRAGAVMIFLMGMGIKRDEAAKFSFLLAVPTIAAASLLDLVKSFSLLSGNLQNSEALVVGFFCSFISAWLVVKWFIRFLQSHDLAIFGWYRLIVSVLLFTFVH